MNRWSVAGLVVLTLFLTSVACSDDRAVELSAPAVPAGLGLVCIHFGTSTKVRDDITSAVKASRAHLLQRCPGGSEADSPVVAFPAFDPAAPEVTAAALGRIVRSTEGGFEPVRVAVIREMPSEPQAVEMARRKPIIESLYYCNDGSCAPVQYEVYVVPEMNSEALISRIEAAADVPSGR